MDGIVANAVNGINGVLTISRGGSNDDVSGVVAMKDEGRVLLLT